jgi:hypothetical protein
MREGSLIVENKERKYLQPDEKKNRRIHRESG